MRVVIGALGFFFGLMGILVGARLGGEAGLTVMYLSAAFMLLAVTLVNGGRATERDTVREGAAGVAFALNKWVVPALTLVGGGIFSVGSLIGLVTEPSVPRGAAFALSVLLVAASALTLWHGVRGNPVKDPGAVER